MVLALLLASAFDPGPCRASLLVPSVSDERLNVVVRLEPEPGWHTYWKNAGDTGSPTTVKWTLPEGWSAGPVQWPTPQRIDTDGTVSFGYEGTVDLVVEIKRPAGADGPIRARVDWLVCKDVCMAGGADLTAVATSSSGRFGSMPVPLEGLDVSASVSGKWMEFRVVAPWDWPSGAKSAFLFPEDANVLDHSEPQEFQVEGRTLSARLSVSPYARTAPKRLRAVLAPPHGEKWPSGATGLLIDVPVSASEQESLAR